MARAAMSGTMLAYLMRPVCHQKGACATGSEDSCVPIEKADPNLKLNSPSSKRQIAGSQAPSQQAPSAKPTRSKRQAGDEPEAQASEKRRTRHKVRYAARLLRPEARRHAHERDDGGRDGGEDGRPRQRPHLEGRVDRGRRNDDATNDTDQNPDRAQPPSHARAVALRAQGLYSFVYPPPLLGGRVTERTIREYSHLTPRGRTKAG